MKTNSGKVSLHSVQWFKWGRGVMNKKQIPFCLTEVLSKQLTSYHSIPPFRYKSNLNISNAK